MNYFKHPFLITLFFVASLNTFAQIGFGTTTPAATLEVVGDADDPDALIGIKPPRLTGEQLRAKTYTPAQTGALVYVTAPDTTPEGQTINVTNIKYYYFDGTLWQPISNNEDFKTITKTTDNNYQILATDEIIEYIGVTGTEGLNTNQVLFQNWLEDYGFNWFQFRLPPASADVAIGQEFFVINNCEDLYAIMFFDPPLKMGLHSQNARAAHIRRGDCLRIIHTGNGVYAHFVGI